MPIDELTGALSLERENLYVALGALGLFLLMVLGHRVFFGGWRGGGELVSAIREKLRWVSFPLLVAVPLWWATTQLDSLFFLSVEMFLTVVLVVAVMVLESLRMLLVRRLAVSGVTLGVLLYSVPILLYLVSMAQMKKFEGVNGYVLGTVLVLFLFLHLVHTYFFRWVQWTHPLALVLRRRLSALMYLGVIGFTLYFGLVRYRGLDVGERFLAALASALVLLFVLVVAEAVLASVFDFYFPIARKSEIPTFFRDLVRGLVYIGLFLAFVGLVLKRDLDSLLVGSAVITVSVGFALQETLGNFFAGLALRLSRPYTLGDFVQVGDVEGRVDKIDWRQTSVYTFTGDHMVLPNSMLAKEAIHNYSSPTKLHARDVRVGLHYRHPPNKVIGVMRVVIAGVDLVSSVPAPEFHVLSFDDSAIDYRIRFWIEDYSRRYEIETQIRIGLWYAFRRANLEIPFPIRTLIQETPEPDATKLEIEKFLATVDFLEALGEEHLSVLADRARFQLFAAGEKICVQGEPGDSFYVIRSGKVGVEVRDASGEVFLSSEIAVGNYFGEMALLTGEPRSATVFAVSDSELLTVGKDDLRDLIVAHPDVEQVICKVLAQRQLRTERAREEAEEERASRGPKGDASGGHRLEQLSEQLLRKIQTFFSY